MEYVELVSKCIFFYLIIIISLRVMGKREVGELSVLDIVIYFVMSEVYALSISEPDQSIWKALIAILTLTVLQILIAWACLKKKKWRDFFEGKPSLIIYNGMIDQREMKKQRYTIDDLMYQLRDKDVSTPEEVQFAILENSGTLTVLKKRGQQAEVEGSADLRRHRAAAGASGHRQGRGMAARTAGNRRHLGSGGCVLMPVAEEWLFRPEKDSAEPGRDAARSSPASR